MDTETSSIIPVKVAVRVRPFDNREKEENAQQCLQYFVQQNQLLVSDRVFTFDFVFDPLSSQDAVYESCAAPLIDKLFKGYNCTVFAYGQTGSGKTYTMGTEQTTDSIRVGAQHRGIIPQMVSTIFDRIAQHPSTDCFSVNCSMLEIYEERVIDLLGTSRDALTIREANKGNVFVQGLSEHCVRTLIATIAELERGCLIRSSGETAMNNKSSRSHAIFTLTINKVASDDDGTNFQVKLNLVDLAGSERLKKTQAQGERLKEGIKINEGLLALGNVISALTETGNARLHIPYRDSKLTRLLQGSGYMNYANFDSLGGNSYTLMIACVSPADTNCEETLSTLRYAERAKRIKNKPIVNQDPNAATIQLLRQQVAQLTHRLLQYDSGEITNDGQMSTVDRRELEELRATRHRAEITADRLQTRLAEAVADRARLYSRLASSEEKRERMSKVFESIRQMISEKLENVNDQQMDVRTILIELQNILATGQDNVDENENSFDNKKNELSGSSLSSDNDDSDIAVDDDQYATRFADVESARAREVDDLMNQIREHESRIANINANERETRQLREKYLELETKIDKIQAERDQLAEQVRRAANSTKLSEERRKRLQEVERELAEKRRALNELKSVEKISTQREEDLKKYQQALKELKCRQVNLMKEQRQEAEKFRKWKLKYDLEMNRMKHRERKREYDHARLTQQKEQQLRVCQRKLEETHAINKRMQLQLDRKEVTKNRKFADNTETDKLVREIKAFLEQELDLVSSTEEAQISCKELIQQRKEASREMAKLQKKRDRLDSNEPAKKRRTGSDRTSDDCSTEIVELDAAIEKLQQQVELRAEIRELQNKCSAVDLDACVEQRWTCIHTVAQAKCALKLLFEMVIDERKDGRHAAESIEELKEENRGLFMKIAEKEEIADECRRLLDESNKEKRELISMSIRKHQEHEAIVISVVNRELNNAELDVATIRQLKMLHEDIFQRETLEKHCKELEDQLQELKRQKSTAPASNRSRLFRSIVSTSDIAPSASIELAPPLKSKRHSKRVERYGDYVSSSMIDEDDVSDEAEDIKDYSFHDGTPIAVVSNRRPMSVADANVGCRCRHRCATVENCRCRQQKRQCNAKCACPHTCTSRVTDDDNDQVEAANRTFTKIGDSKTAVDESAMTPDENISTMLNQTFKKCEDETTTMDDDNNLSSPMQRTMLGGGGTKRNRHQQQFGLGGGLLFKPLLPRSK